MYVEVCFATQDACPVCREPCTVTLVAPLAELPKEIKYFCVEHGVWRRPLKLKIWIDGKMMEYKIA